MKKRLLIIAAVLVAVIMLLTAFPALADFGGFSGDSDYGGSWDIGGGDSDWGSSWSDSDSSGGFWIFGGGGDYYDSDSREVSCSAFDIMMVLVIIFIIIFIIAIFRKSASQNPVTTTVQRTDDSMLTPIEQYVANVDRNFSVSGMTTKINNLYVQLQDQWCARDLEPLRPYLTDELYNQSERQLEELRKNRRTPHVERIAVLGTDIRGYFVREGMDHLIVELNTRINTYTTDDETGNIVSGEPNVEKFMTYEWDLCRTAGMTDGSRPTTITNCPNCGAPVNINKTARCPYCETIITVNEHDWLLYSIKGLSQRTQ